jgi:dienelactone hydrolase
MANRFARIAFVVVLLQMTANGILAQENPAAEHAKRVVNLLQQQKFAEVAAEFNAQVAAALSVAQLREVWGTVIQQAGQFKSFMDERVITPASGTTAVVLGCQFDKAALNVIVAFDTEKKIAGLRFTPRPATDETPAAPPAGARFKEEALTVGAAGWALPGTLSMPNEGTVPAVILVHGSGPHDRDETIGPNKPFRDLAWGLADRGIAVLRYEKRTRQYAGKIAGGQTFTVREEVIEDALAAVAALRKHDRIDPKRIFVLGHSLGGMVAPRIAAADTSVAGLVIMAGTTRPLLDVAREQLAYLARLNPDSPSPEKGIEQLKRAAPDAYWKDLDAYNPASTAAKLAIPMLILQGERDYQVTARDLQGWRDALGGHAGVTIKSYPALNHLFQPGEGKSTPAEYQQAGHMPDLVFDDIARWINQNHPGDGSHDRSQDVSFLDNIDVNRNRNPGAANSTQAGPRGSVPAVAR